jgi:Zn-dependent protease/CBS domain-containing protein
MEWRLWNMRWSFRIARIKGIDIRVHATFALVLAWTALDWGNRQGLTGALYGLIFITLLFLCVTLHELGHSLVALHYGMKVRDITLLPIGGVARLEGELKRPAHEFWMALAGPTVNLVIGGLIGSIVVPWFGWQALDGLSLLLGRLRMLGTERLLVDLLTANLGLAVFNLLPAFPMDGGRVLRALLASRISELQATRIAMYVGQGVAVILGLAGVFTGALNLTLIAMFIYVGARQEWREKQFKTAMQQVPASAALIRGDVILSPDDQLARAIDATLRTGQRNFAVFDRGYLVGVLTREDTANAFHRYGARILVQRVMRTNVPVAQSSDTLFDLQRKMQTSGSSAISVTEGGRFLGLATLDSVQGALRNFLRWGRKSV